jgi:pyruvate/2-oxoacid:ferredoxin oxidoreductase alpha subunit
MKEAVADVQSMTKVITANAAAAWGAFLARPHVVAAYPITPQTTIIETLAELTSQTPGRCRFITVESEHSALSACAGASYAGARVFTATSSQGLLLMHEIIHWAAGGRLPIVMVNVNRALAPGWSIFTDQNDSLSQRDTGWMQVYCQSAQEVLDAVVIGFRVAETVQIPVMIVLDAFVLSHTAEAVEIPTQDSIDEFLPPREPVYELNVNKPAAFGGLLSPEYYQEVRQKLHEDMLSAIPTWETYSEEWAAKTGRKIEMVQPYRCKDAEIILITSGTPSMTAQVVIDEYRERGQKIGLLALRLFRPFPGEQIRKILAGVPKVAVMDRNCSYGHHGIWFQELKSSLYNMPEKKRPTIFGHIAGLGGRDITVETIRSIIERTRRRKNSAPETVWVRDL